MVTYGAYGKQITDNGYTITPIVKGKKSPAIKDWSMRPEPPPFEDYSSCGVGIRCGLRERPVYAIDVDVMDTDAVNLIHTFIPSAPYRIGQPPKRLYLFRSDTPLIRKKKSKVYEEGHIELLGFGQQFVAFGIHPVLKSPYQWPGGSILETKYEQLPKIDGEAIDRIFSEFESAAEILGFTPHEDEFDSPTGPTDFEPDNPLFEKDPIGVSHAKLQMILDKLDPDCGRDQWRNIGFALHHETSGEDEGFRLWDEWSAKGSKYKDGETEKQWASFGRSSHEQITAAYLLKLYKAIVPATDDSIEEFLQEDDYRGHAPERNNRPFVFCRRRREKYTGALYGDADITVHGIRT